MIEIGDCGDDMEHLPPQYLAVDPEESSGLTEKSERWNVGV